MGTKFAEKLSLLLGIGDTILARLHKAKTCLSSANTRPAVLSDPATAKVFATVAKKFPEITEAAGLDTVINSANDAYAEFEDYYYTFVDTLNYTNTTKTVLEELTVHIAAFQMDKNPVSTEAFLDLTGLLVRALILLSSIPDRKTVLIIFAKLYQKNQNKPEENYKDVATFIAAYEQPIKRLQSDLNEGVAQSLGHALIDLGGPFLASHNVDQMRKTGVLSISNKPAEMCFPSITPAQLLVPLSPKIYSWIVYGFLLTPEQFAMPEPMDILKVALQQSYLVPLYLNEMHYIHAEYENMFSTYKSANKLLSKQFKKDKKNFGEILAQSVQPTLGTKNRNDRRTFIRHELQQLVLLMKDFPGLLGPKIETIWGALSLAKEEVFWYFAHRTKAPPKGVAKAFQEKLYFDPNITELIYNMEEMANVVRQNKAIIQQYYLEYLSGADLSQASDLIQKKLLSKVSRGNIVDALHSILQDLQSISIDTFNEGHEYSFQALRMNWFRVETWLMSPGCPAGDINSNSELIKRMNLIVHHTKNVDAIEYLLWDYGSLHGLVNFPNTIVKEFETCLSNDNASYITTWLQLLGKFPEAVSSLNMEEKPRIGESCINIATQCLGKLVDRISSLITSIVTAYIGHEGQLDPVKAAALIKLEDVEGVQKYVVNSTGLDPFNFPPDKLGDLKQQHNLLTRLCSVFRNCEHLYVFTQILSPPAFLRESLAVNFRAFILKAQVIPPLDKEATVTVQRPSVLLNQIQIYRSVLQLVSQLTLMDTSVIVQEVILDLTSHRVFDSDDPLAWVTTNGVEINRETAPLIAPYADLYFDFVSKRMEYGAMIYSPIRASFAVRGPVRVDDYCCLKEFTALAQLIGSRGIRLIDRVFLNFIYRTVGALKETLIITKPELEEFELAYTTDECLISARKLRDIESFMLKSVSIGNCFVFRKLLYQGLHAASQSQIPLLQNSVQTLFTNYNRAHKHASHVNQLALESGVITSVHDPALIACLQPLTKDLPEIWNLLPFMFAGGLFTSIFQNTVYKASLDLFTNNVQGLIEAIYLLCTCVHQHGEHSKSSHKSVENFVTVVALTLLRLYRINPKDLQKRSPFASLHSLVVFLDLFVKQIDFIPRNFLSNILPYSIIRSAYRDLYAGDEPPSN